MAASIFSADETQITAYLNKDAEEMWELMDAGSPEPTEIRTYIGPINISFITSRTDKATWWMNYINKFSPHFTDTADATTVTQMKYNQHITEEKSIGGTSVMDFTKRNMYSTMFSYPVLTNELVNAIAAVLNEVENGPIIEVVAGTGWLSYFCNAALERMGSVKRISVSDLAVKQDSSWFNRGGIYAPTDYGDIVELDAVSHIQFAKPTTVIMSWPPMKSDVAFRVVKEMLAQKSSTLIYLGEGAGGCCANNDFFVLTHFFKSVHKEINQSHIRWYGQYDYVWVYKLDQPAHKFAIVDIRGLNPVELADWIKTVLKKNEHVDGVNNVDDLIKFIKTDHEKLYKVKERLQLAIRFIEIQLGITIIEPDICKCTIGWSR
jgi:hypothetical protein